jgi:Cu(I)/Ag(I) efflux system membrane fusion protein/cobalt-zinc-cadmium efflux system membrane fusion protein
VPASAIFQTGTRQLVFVNHDNGSLEPKDVVLGPQEGDSFVVLKGLEAHQQIVTSANFLLDSESQLQAAAGSNAPPSPGAGNTAQQQTGQPASTVNIDFTIAPNPPQKGPNTLHVKLTANGNPVFGADVGVTFFMPAMPAMGMAAIKKTAQLTPKGNGLYEGQINIDSTGTWDVTTVVQQNGQNVATKQLRVNAEGGR